jgi:uncharacterized protein
MPGSATPIDTSGQAPQSHIDPVTRDALRSFKEILAAKYGPHLRSLYLFGSRARGDHCPDSDIDIAVFLDEATDPVGEQFDLIERGYDIVLNSGVNIQPWVFAQASLSDPAHHRAAHLVRTIRREGIPL